MFFISQIMLTSVYKNFMYYLNYMINNKQSLMVLHLEIVQF